ncbi:heat shock factor protein HSF30-like [Cornus florida]|uniref:heat shock factor protein HSF30-like n=1 Tax=Cornus florida TaxID=4283 RepID=UPI0028A0426F|nr:heat shock factor protein HSF30-like [Cornus florida]
MEAKTIKQELEIVIVDDNTDVGGGGSGYGNRNNGGGGGGCLAEKNKAMKIEVDINGGVGSSGAGGGGGGNDNGGHLSRCLPPPFLRKTFDIVQNPETDSIISWSADLRSFIVWDSIKFARDIIPKHFRHDNFHSFIVSLNAYGFRKIHPDRWEFANEEFQGGKRHLLNNIKRRRKPPQRSPCADPATYKLELQLEKLRNDQKKMQIELLRLKRRQEDIQNELTDVEKRLQSTTHSKQRLVTFLAKVFNPTNLQQFILQLRQNRELAGGEISKKRKFIALSSNECPVEAADTTSQNVNCSSQKEEELATLQSDIQTSVSPLKDDQSGSPNHDKKDHEVFGTSTLEFNSEDFIPWEKLMLEDLIFENEAEEELGQHHSKFVLELEDLIKQQAELGGYVNELVEQAGKRRCVEEGADGSNR